MEPIATLVADPPWPFRDRLPGGGRGAEKHYSLLGVRDLVRFPLPPLAENARLFMWRVASMQAEALAVIDAWGFTVKSEIVWVKTPASEPAPLDPKGRRAALRLTRAQLASMAGVSVRDVKRFERSAEEFYEYAPEDCLSIQLALSNAERASARAEVERVRIGMGRQVRNAHEVCLIATRGRPAQLDKATPSVLFAPRGAHSAKPAAFYDLVERVSPGPLAELFARQERAGWECFGDELERAQP